MRVLSYVGINAGRLWNTRWERRETKFPNFRVPCSFNSWPVIDQETGTRLKDSTIVYMQYMYSVRARASRQSIDRWNGRRLLQCSLSSCQNGRHYQEGLAGGPAVSCASTEYSTSMLDSSSAFNVP